jgi:hypothetical protein
MMTTRKKNIHADEPVLTKIVMIDDVKRNTVEKTSKPQADNSTLVKKLRTVEIVCKR